MFLAGDLEHRRRAAMSKLTNERLEEMKSNVFSLKSISEAEQIAMIDELLSLRTAAAPEMGEVEALMEKWKV